MTDRSYVEHTVVMQLEVKLQVEHFANDVQVPGPFILSQMANITLQPTEDRDSMSCN